MFDLSKITTGYLDGLCDERDELPESSNYSQQYRHGWNNGRDDRLNKPRSAASVLRETSEKLIREDL